MIEIVQKLLGAHGNQLIQTLTAKAGFSPEQARGFLPPAVQQIVGVLQGGGLNLASLLGGGGVQSLLAKLDPSAVAAEAPGVDAQQAKQGLEALAPEVLSTLKQSGNLENLIGGQAGGLMGAAGKLAGKLFK